MEITYDLIIKYLMPKENNYHVIENKNIIITETHSKQNLNDINLNHESNLEVIKSKTKSLIETNSDFLNNKNNQYIYYIDYPKKFISIFPTNFFRYNIINNNLQLSFLNSILILLNDDKLLNNNELLNDTKLLNSLLDDLIKNYSKKKISSVIKNYNKKYFKELISINNNFSNTNSIYIVCQYITDILNINIFIFDFELENIYCTYTDNKLNAYKQSILLVNNKTLWEPIIYKKDNDIKTKFNFDDIIIKNLLTNNYDIKYYGSNILNKNFIFNQNFNEDFKNLNKTKLNKMKLEELTILLNKLNITLNQKKIIKKDAIQLILNKINL